ncbi:MAG: hypothetical protein H0W90_12665 [Actinobacteria bacterium]|nr:hypothetical protein [Actinomycetota bacterium]
MATGKTIAAAVLGRVGIDLYPNQQRTPLVEVRTYRLMTPPTFCEVSPPDRSPIHFYRYPTAPDWQLSSTDFDGAEIASAPFLLATGTGLAQSPSRETTLAALAAQRKHDHLQPRLASDALGALRRIRRARPNRGRACRHRDQTKSEGRSR